MNRSDRVAIFRLDIALVLLLGLAGLGVWMVTERLVATMLAGWKPIEKQYQLGDNIPHLQSELKREQDRLEKNRSKLVEQDIELERQESALVALRKTYPQLLADLPALQQAGASQDVLRSYAAALANRRATQQRLDAWQRRLDSLFDGGAPPSAESLETKGGAEGDVRQARQRILKAELSSVEGKLVAERIALAEQTHIVETMKENFPALQKVPEMRDTPAEAVQAYINVQLGVIDARRQIAELTASMSASVAAVSQRTSILFAAEGKAANSLTRDTALFGIIKSFITLVAASILTFLLLLWVFGLLRRHGDDMKFNAAGVRWAVGALLTILFLYEAFQAASIAIAAVALLTMLCWLIRAGARKATNRRRAALPTETAPTAP